MNTSALATVSITVTPHVAPIVRNTNDSGPDSLRQALLDARGADVITFQIPTSDPGYSNGAWMITLTSGELTVSRSISIQGPGAKFLTISGNNASRIFNATNTNSTISGMTLANGNGEGADPGRGGAIAIRSGTVNLRDLVVRNNSANLYGGGLSSDNLANVNVERCAFHDNTVATFFGGGLYNFGSTLTVVNSTISRNTAQQGGGVFCSVDGITTLSNSTISGNSATSGGGVGNRSVVNLRNTIVANSVSGGDLFNSPSGMTNAAYSWIGDALTAINGTSENNQTGDPILGPLQDNGGSTPTQAPLSNSPVIDQGKDLTGSGQDQRGATRPVDYGSGITPPAEGDRSDIGAVELSPGLQPLAAVSRKVHGSAGALDLSLNLSGPVVIEPRSGGATMDHQIVLTFAAPVTFDSAAVVDGTGTIASIASAPGDNTKIIVNLTGVSDAQRLTLAVFGVDDGTRSGDVGLRIGFLVGDISGDGAVNGSDIGLVKMQTGSPVDSTTIRSDVIANGSINASDIGQVKAASGTVIP